MGRDECILWPTEKRASSPNYPSFSGTVRLAGGAYYRIAIWPRGKKPEFNINFVPWDRRTRKPIPNGTAIFTMLRHSLRARGTWAAPRLPQPAPLNRDRVNPCQSKNLSVDTPVNVRLRINSKMVGRSYFVEKQ